MGIDEISAEHKERVQEVQSLLAAGGLEVLHSYYFNMLLHETWNPGSLGVRCLVCDEFDIDTGPMHRLTCGPSDLMKCSVLFCYHCTFSIPFPYGIWRSETLIETMRWIAKGGMGWDDFD